MPMIRSLAVTIAASRLIGVLGTDDGGASIVELETGEQSRILKGDGGPAVTAITCARIAGRQVAILAGQVGLRGVLDLSTGEIIDAGGIDDPLLAARRSRPPLSSRSMGRC